MRVQVCRYSVVLGLVVWGGSAALAQETEAPKSDPKKATSDQTTEARRQALQLLAEAETALESGHTARASALAREAQRLYPESKSIAGFLSSLAADSLVGVRGAGTSTHNRAKAHLAAALSRAQVLMQQRRYTESLDLLNGIIEATGKFPESADVS